MVAVSSFRETDPVGVVDQPRFVNAAVALETSLSPRELLDRLLDVERALGRDRAVEERWGPRTLDLDLLLYGGEIDRRAGARGARTRALPSAPSSSSPCSSSTPTFGCRMGAPCGICTARS